MRFPLRCCVLAFSSLLIPARILAAQGDDRPQEGHWSCFTAYDPGESIYVTPVWDGAALMQEVSNAFSGFLFTKYGYKDRVFCSRAIMSGSTVAKLTGDNESRNKQWAAAGKKIVATGWTFDPASARLPYLCAGYAQVRTAGVLKEYHFINKVLQIPGSTQDKLSLAWVDYLNKLNPGYYYQSPGCLLLPAEPTAQKERIDGQIGMYAARKPEIVRTEWELP